MQPVRRELLRRAEAGVLCDLINLLLYENLFGILERGVTETTLGQATAIPDFDLRADELYFRLELKSSERVLLFRVRRHPFLQPYRLSRPPVVVAPLGEAEYGGTTATSAEVLRMLAADHSAEDWVNGLPNLNGCLADVQDAVTQTALSLEAVGPILRVLSSGHCLSLMDWEQASALRDRPFHPIARAKTGWSEADYRRYCAEFGGAFGLDWIAVRRDRLCCGATSSDLEIAPHVLDADSQERLDASLTKARIPRDSYAVLPVHPWQTNHLLTLYADELASDVCILVARDLGKFRATSSIRSLAPASGGAIHLKLPLNLSSLGALRMLPPRYLNNGEQGQHLLEQLIAADRKLAEQLYLCDEQYWWACRPPESDPFADKPGHLACLLRRYPAQLIEDPSVTLVPMSALAVTTPDGCAPAASSILWQRGEHEPTPAQVLDLFRELCDRLLEVALRCFRAGAMPEIHGQNVVLVVREGRITGLLLRDHDTVRIHLPWLAKAGLAEPGYILNPDTPNTLITDTPEPLVRYIQTLGVQVNLYAIADALSKTYAIDEGCFWEMILASLDGCFSRIDLPSHVQELLRSQFLEQDTWPTKLVLTPLLYREGTGGGSMPSGWGVIRNPLRCLSLVGTVGEFRS